MKIYRMIKNADRQHGKTLPQIGYTEKYVYIFRAVSKTVTTINYMDYVTRSKRFANEHADHMAATTEEDQVVLRAMVESKDVAEAYNPGEYFYIGKDPVNGNVSYESKYENV